MTDLALSADVCARTGLTRRRLDYWMRQGAIAPTRRGRSGGARYRFGEVRRDDCHGWSSHDVAKLRAIAAVDRDLREFGAELRVAGVARLWEALEDRQATIRVGSIVVDFSALTVAALQDLAEAAS